jgi:hypothetical protein
VCNNPYTSATNYYIGHSPVSMISSNFNNNMKLDLLVANFKSNNVNVLFGNGDGTFLVKFSYNTGDRPSFLISDDFNNVGKMDLAVANKISGDVGIFLNTC